MRRKRPFLVKHRTRPQHHARYPVQIILRVRPELGSIRTVARLVVIERAIREGCDRLGMRVLEFWLEDHRIILMVEAQDKGALSRGMQGLNVRLARGLNRVSDRKGRVFVERYFARRLESIAKVRKTLRHLYTTAQRLDDQPPWRLDPFSSGEGVAFWWDEKTLVLAQPRSWLFRQAKLML